MQSLYFITLLNICVTVVGIDLAHINKKTVTLSSNRQIITDVSTSKFIPTLSLLSVDATAEEKIPVIKVVFPDGTEDVTILKQHDALGSFKGWNPTLACNYMGHLKSEPEATVAATGCIRQPKDKMYVTLISRRSRYHKSFSIDGQGNVNHIKIINNPTGQDNDDEILNTTIEDEAAHVPESQLQSVPFSLKVSLKIAYDTSFRDAFNTDQERFEFIAEVMSHTQAHYMDSSLNHHIYLDVDGDIIAFPGLLDTDNQGLYVANTWVQENGDPDISLYMFLTDTASLYQIAGQAFVGTVCNNNAKTSISKGPEWGIISTVNTLSHELGHNFGMSHDFAGSHGTNNCRRSDNGDTIQCSECSGSGYDDNGNSLECCTGYMDYTSGPTYWSPCSVRFFEEHWIAESWQRDECAPEVAQRDVTFPLGGAGETWNGYLDCPAPIVNLELVNEALRCSDLQNLAADQCDVPILSGTSIFKPSLPSFDDAEYNTITPWQLCPFTLQNICQDSESLPSPVCLAPTLAPTPSPTLSPTLSPTFPTPSPTPPTPAPPTATPPNGACTDDESSLHPGISGGVTEFQYVGSFTTMSECVNAAKLVDGALGITVPVGFPNTLVAMSCYAAVDMDSIIPVDDWNACFFFGFPTQAPTPVPPPLPDCTMNTGFPNDGEYESVGWYTSIDACVRDVDGTTNQNGIAANGIATEIGTDQDGYFYCWGQYGITTVADDSWRQDYQTCIWGNNDPTASSAPTAYSAIELKTAHKANASIINPNKPKILDRKPLPQNLLSKPIPHKLIISPIFPSP